MHTMWFAPNGPSSTVNLYDTVPSELGVVTLMPPRLQSPAPVWFPLFAHSVTPSCSTGKPEPVMVTTSLFVSPVLGVIVIVGPALVVEVVGADVVGVVAVVADAAVVLVVDDEDVLGLLLHAANATIIVNIKPATCSFLFIWYSSLFGSLIFPALVASSSIVVFVHLVFVRLAFVHGSQSHDEESSVFCLADIEILTGAPARRGPSVCRWHQTVVPSEVVKGGGSTLEHTSIA